MDVGIEICSVWMIDLGEETAEASESPDEPSGVLRAWLAALSERGRFREENKVSSGFSSVLAVGVTGDLDALGLHRSHENGSPPTSTSDLTIV